MIHLSLKSCHHLETPFGQSRIHWLSTSSVRLARFHWWTIQVLLWSDGEKIDENRCYEGERCLPFCLTFNSFTTWKGSMAQLPLVLVYHGPLRKSHLRQKFGVNDRQKLCNSEIVKSPNHFHNLPLKPKNRQQNWWWYFGLQPEVLTETCIAPSWQLQMLAKASFSVGSMAIWSMIGGWVAEQWINQIYLNIFIPPFPYRFRGVLKDILSI